MLKYLIIHNKHEGCYDFQYYEDEVEKIRLTSITINPPKIFMFNSKQQAQDFAEAGLRRVVGALRRKCDTYRKSVMYTENLRKTPVHITTGWQ